MAPATEPITIPAIAPPDNVLEEEPATTTDPELAAAVLERDDVNPWDVNPWEGAVEEDDEDEDDDDDDEDDEDELDFDDDDDEDDEEEEEEEDEDEEEGIGPPHAY